MPCSSTSSNTAQYDHCRSLPFICSAAGAKAECTVKWASARSEDAGKAFAPAPGKGPMCLSAPALPDQLHTCTPGVPSDQTIGLSGSLSTESSSGDQPYIPQLLGVRAGVPQCCHRIIDAGPDISGCRSLASVRHSTDGSIPVSPRGCICMLSSHAYRPRSAQQQEKL